MCSLRRYFWYVAFLGRLGFIMKLFRNKTWIYNVSMLNVKIFANIKREGQALIHIPLHASEWTKYSVQNKERCTTMDVVNCHTNGTNHISRHISMGLFCTGGKKLWLRKIFFYNSLLDILVNHKIHVHVLADMNDFRCFFLDVCVYLFYT